MFAYISKVEGLYKVRICTQAEILFVKYFGCISAAKEYAAKYSQRVSLSF